MQNLTINFRVIGKPEAELHILKFEKLHGYMYNCDLHYKYSHTFVAI